MKLQTATLSTKYLFFLFFLLGFNKFIFYVPATILYLLVFNKQWQINKSFLIFALINICVIIFLFLLGYDRMTPEEPLKLFIVFLFIIIATGFLIQNRPKKIQTKMLTYYIIGFGFQASIIAGYSYLFNDGSYGYGNLYNPFTQEEINSPITSNNLSILASLVIFYLFNQSGFIRKFLLTLILLIVSGLGIFLGGRTFFIILFFALLYSVIRPLTFNKLTIIFILTAGLLLVSTYISDFINIDFILKRFERGLESKRFLHYQHGISEFFKHPLGGYTIDESIEKTRWFHNIFLDMGRLGGWIPVGLFTLSLIYVALKSCKKILFANTHYSLAILMFLISFLILQQDTSIEGDYRAYIVMYLSSIILLTKNYISLKPNNRLTRNGKQHESAT